jgi:mRNA interferase RelE/StbE
METARLETLTGELAGFHKLRVGDYRVIYLILHDEQTLVVNAVGHRREIYRKR